MNAAPNPTLAPLRFSHRCMWVIMSRCPGFYRVLKADHPNLLRSLPPKYRRRVAQSTIRTCSFLSMLAQVMNRPFDVRTAVLGGILAALFDDLFDLGFETPERVLEFIARPGEARCQREEGAYFRHLYAALRARLEPWQAEQLRCHLYALVRSETEVARGRGSPNHWEEQGTAAFVVYLTLLGISDSLWNDVPVRRFGEYLQMLDDYEDYGHDAPDVNYFHAHPDADLDTHFKSHVGPVLKDLFLSTSEGGPELDLYLFSEFMATYHVFVSDVYTRLKPAKPMSDDRHAVLGSVGAPLPTAESRVAAGVGVWRPLWKMTALFTTLWPRSVPTRIHLAITKLVMAGVRRFLPYSP